MNAIFKRIVNVVTLSSFFMWNLAVAAPEGGSVVQGSAAISQSGSTTTIAQSSQNAVINWTGFNTASHEAVNFVQPNASAIALNRINSGQPTTFAGSLSANGQVWIVNPNGILFTSTSSVNVAGLLATTHDISDANFMAGHYQFNLAPGYENSKIINNGLITAKDSGIVALVAPGVENNGVIVANLGKVALASGTAYVLDLNGDQLINFGSSPAAQKGYVSNSGRITATGGKVWMTANVAARAVDNVINMSGVIEARSVGTSHGRIVLNGGHHGKVHVSGKLDASTGGFIETSGEVVVIEPTAVVDAGKGGTWFVDPAEPWLIDTNIANGDWADIISNQLSSGTNFIMSGIDIFILSAITQAPLSNFAIFELDASNTLTVSAPITLVNGALTLTAATVLVTAAPIIVSGGAVYLFSSGDIDVGGTIDVTNGSLEILSGYNNVNINAAITGTNLDFVEIYGAQSVTLNAPITTNNAHLDVEAGYCYDGCLSDPDNNFNLNVNATISATNNNVDLYANDYVYVNDPIMVTSGGLEIDTAFWDITISAPITADNYINIYSDNDLYLESAVTVTNGSLDAEAYGFSTNFGEVSVDAPIMVTNGNVLLFAYDQVDVNDSVTVNNGGFRATSVYGDVNVYAPVMASDYIDLYAAYDVYVDDGVALTVTNGGLDIEGGYCDFICSDSGTVTINGPISLTNGDAYIYAPDSVTTNDTIDVTNGGLELETDYYSIHMNGEVTIMGSNNAYFDAYAGGSVHIDAPVTVTNTDGYFDDGDYAIDIEGGNENSWGKIYINYPIMLDGGDAYLYTTNNIYVNDTITVMNGGLEISTGFSGGSVYIDAPITVDNYLDIYPDGNLYVDEAVTVNFGGLDIEAGNNVYLNAPIIANDDTYIYGSTVHVNAGITINDGSLEFEMSDGGPIYINTSDPIVSDGNQYYDNRVLLGNDNVTLTSNFGRIYFDSTVDTSWCFDGAANLTINVLNGFVKFRDNVGDNNPLNNLVVNGATKFWNWCNSLDVITWLSQIYNGQVTSNTDMLLLTIQNGGIFLNQGYSAPDNGLTLVTGSDSDFIGGGVFGNNIDVGFILFGGTGSVDLTNTTVNGFSGSDAFAQADIEGTGDHYCVNGLGVGSCVAIPAPLIAPPLEMITRAETLIPPITTPTNIWNITVTDANGNDIEECDEYGCVMTMTK